MTSSPVRLRSSRFELGPHLFEAVDVETWLTGRPHERATFADAAAAGAIPDDKILIPGVLDTEIAYAKLAAMAEGTEICGYHVDFGSGR